MMILRVRAHAETAVTGWYMFSIRTPRSEMFETALQDTLPPMTVMAPGPPAPPILPKTPGVLPGLRSSKARLNRPRPPAVVFLFSIGTALGSPRSFSGTRYVS
jgi:hypothetical protein